jgi:hypothetical protein
MKLYDLTLSGNCHKVRLFLSLIGQPVELVPVNLLAGEHKQPAFREINPRGQIKINRRVRFDRCVFGGPLTGLGAGVEDLLVRDCDVMGDANGRGIDMAPRGVQFAGTVRVFGRMTFQNAPTVSVPGPVVISGGNLQ